MFNLTVEELIIRMLSIVTFTFIFFIEFQSTKELSAGKQITTSSGKIKLQQLFSTSRSIKC